MIIYTGTTPQKVDKSKWCTACGGPGIRGKQHLCISHQRCTGKRRTIDRRTLPCECPCKLDPAGP